jgi:hypothetical protein
MATMKNMGTKPIKRIIKRLATRWKMRREGWQA